MKRQYGNLQIITEDLEDAIEQKDETCKNYDEGKGLCVPGCYEEKVGIGEECPYAGEDQSGCQCYSPREGGARLGQD